MDSSSSSDEEELMFPSTNPAADEVSEHTRKKRKIGRDAKESAALGIFGSDSEDERPKRRLRGKGVGFMKAGAAKEEDEDEDEDDDDHNYGMRATPLGRGFAPTSAQQPLLRPGLPAGDAATPKTVRPSFNSPTAFSRQNGTGKGSPAQGAAVNPNSFAAKMMAKMGYKEGQGLGTSGQGIINPIETKLRPQGAGLGAVREKTEQAKEEAKREAARSGEILEDSSEEERKRKRRQKKERGIGGGSGVSTPAGRRAKPKLKYRTAADIEAAADGLEVPKVLKSIIDATGKEPKLLTSTSGLLTPVGAVPTADPEAMKIAKRARRDLEAFAEEWNGLRERNKYIELQESQLSQEILAEEEDFRKRKGVTDAVRSLQRLELSRGDGTGDLAGLGWQWEEIVGRLETLETEYHDDVNKYGLSEVAVGALHPIFRLEMEGWSPMADPKHLVPYFRRLQSILGIKPQINVDSIALQNGNYNGTHHSKCTSPYETLIYTLWLPKIRTAITNEWDVYDPSPLITLIEAWEDILPPFIYTNVIDQLVAQKLTTAVSNWNPRVSHKKKHQILPPHVWLFPWLPYLDEHHVDPKSPTGLLADVKRKFRVVIDTWDLTKGIIPGLQNWREVLRSELDNVLIRHLLPRLALHLQNEFTIDPSDQYLTPLEQVLQWSDFFKPSTIGALLVAEFFPKWHAILHLWLTSSPNYLEISEWFEWWKGCFSESINSLPSTQAEWDRGFMMINQALDLGTDAVTELPPPAAGPTRPIKAVETVPSVTSQTTTPNGRTTEPLEEATFKDVVEAWCAEEDLILISLREAHSQTGLPLFRITASANGRGGVLVYMKGDVLWAQAKKDKALWQPIGLEDELIERAEGR